jgi:hypothetical protein
MATKNLCVTASLAASASVVSDDHALVELVRIS